MQQDFDIDTYHKFLEYQKFKQMQEKLKTDESFANSMNGFTSPFTKGDATDPMVSSTKKKFANSNNDLRDAIT